MPYTLPHYLDYRRLPPLLAQAIGLTLFMAGLVLTMVVAVGLYAGMVYTIGYPATSIIIMSAAAVFAVTMTVLVVRDIFKPGDDKVTFFDLLRLGLLDAWIGICTYDYVIAPYILPYFRP